jgi:hypothetical protein
MRIRQEMKCGENTKLVEEHNRASIASSQAARALSGKMRACPVLESRQLREAADEAHNKSAEALAAVNCHRAEHGC